MKIFQLALEEIQKITGKEYDVEYSNNAESEYVTIYNTVVLEQMLLDLIDAYKRKGEE